MTTTICFTKKELDNLIAATVKETVNQLIDAGILSVNKVATDDKPVKTVSNSVKSEETKTVKVVKKAASENKQTKDEKSKGFKRAHHTAKVELAGVKYIMTTKFGKCEVGTFTHTKTGVKMWAVRACEKLERDVYIDMASHMATLGFRWSPFAMAFIGTDDPTAKIEVKVA